jgi:hypothetical protein
LHALPSLLLRYIAISEPEDQANIATISIMVQCQNEILAEVQRTTKSGSDKNDGAP